MWASYIAAALRRLARDRLSAGVTVAGLALGFVTVILIAIFVRDELSYDRFWPGHERTFVLGETRTLGTMTMPSSTTTPDIGAKLAAASPQVEAMTRRVARNPVIAHGKVQAVENVDWVDANFFAFFPPRALSGRLEGALDQPDTIVLTRALARKYFGRDDVVGETLDLNPAVENAEAPIYHQPHPMKVTAVIADLPSETHLKALAFASGLSAFSPLQAPSGPDIDAMTYIRLHASPGEPAGQAAAASKPLPAIAAASTIPNFPLTRAFRLIPLDQLHLPSQSLDTMVSTTQVGRAARTLTVLAGLGGLILLIAAINFVSLMTARGAGRALEVGVRKACGARRGHLVIQFVGEAMLYVLMALVIGASIAELTLPALNRILGRRMQFSLTHDPALSLGLLIGAVGVGLLAGLYPAIVLAAFRPAGALKGMAGGSGGSGRVRQGLVVVQFAVMIGLILVTVTQYRQTRLLTDRAIRIGGDHLLMVDAPCNDANLERIRAVQGIGGAICSGGSMEAEVTTTHVFRSGGQGPLQISVNSIKPGVFEFYGVKPLAGSLLGPPVATDYLDEPDLLPDGTLSKTTHRSFESTRDVVINETSRRALGFASNAAAVGKKMEWAYDPFTPPDGSPPETEPRQTSTIVGVVADNPVDGRTAWGQAWHLSGEQSQSASISVRMAGDDIPGAMARLDQAWRAAGHARPMDRHFYADEVRERFSDITQFAHVAAACAGVALLIACLGMFALAAYAAQRRTKEIGVRKAMGARTRDVLALLLWQFTKPVILANLIAAPLAFIWLHEWLGQYVQRVSPGVLTFALAAIASLLLAWATVFAQAYAVARAKPVTALRDE